MNEQFFGLTSIKQGSSYLLSKPTIDVYKGYHLGTTTSDIIAGKFDVDSIDYDGVKNQRVSLALSSQRNRGDNIISGNGYVYSSAYINNIVFGNTDNVLSQFEINTTDLGAQSANALTLTDSTEIILATNPIKDFNYNLLVSRGGASNLFDMYFRWQDSFNHYRFTIRSTQYHFIAAVNGVGITISSGNMPYGISIIQDIAVYNLAVNGSRFVLRLSPSDGPGLGAVGAQEGTSYRLVADIVDYRHREPGQLGFGQFSGGENTVELDAWQITEARNLYTVDELISISSRLSLIDSLKIYNTTEGFSSLSISPGSSVIFTDNSTVFHSAGTGNSWHYLMGGMTLNSFILEVDVAGSSGAFAGIGVGNTTRFYTNYLRFGDAVGNSNGIAYYESGVDNIRKGIGLPMPFGITHTYNLKLVKSNINLIWLVNNKVWQYSIGLSTYIGPSLATTPFTNANDLGASVAVGVFVRRDSADGSTVRFNNFKISSLDTLVGEAIIAPNEPINTLMDRLIPESYAYLDTGATIELIPLGISRGIFSIGESQIIELTEYVDNNTGVDSVYLSNSTRVTTRSTNNTRRLRQAATSRTTYIKDDLIADDIETLDSYVASSFLANKNIEPFLLTIRANPVLQLYDQISLVSPLRGISKSYTIYNIVENFNSQSGEYTQTLELSNDITTL